MGGGRVTGCKCIEGAEVIFIRVEGAKVVPVRPRERLAMGWFGVIRIYDTSFASIHPLRKFMNFDADRRFLF